MLTPPLSVLLILTIADSRSLNRSKSSFLEQVRQWFDRENDAQYSMRKGKEIPWDSYNMGDRALESNGSLLLAIDLFIKNNGKVAGLENVHRLANP